MGFMLPANISRLWFLQGEAVQLNSENVHAGQSWHILGSLIPITQDLATFSVPDSALEPPRHNIFGVALRYERAGYHLGKFHIGSAMPRFISADQENWK